MQGLCRTCLHCSRYIAGSSSAPAAWSSARTIPQTRSSRSFTSSVSKYARSRPSRSSPSTGRPPRSAFDDTDGDDLFPADELETRLAALAGAGSSSKAKGRPHHADEVDSIESPHPGASRSNAATSMSEYVTIDEEEATRQREFALYDLSLEEPDIDPRQAYGIRRPSVSRDDLPRSPYPAMIKLRPELDPVADEAAIEEKRRLSQLVRQTESKRQSKASWLSAREMKYLADVQGDFLDYTVIKIRGGRGGAGVASFSMTRDGSLGAPCGGNGGLGGSIYIQTTDRLTSLHTIPRRYIGDQGKNGGRDSRHGQAAPDIVIQVPVGTVIREVIREGDEEKHWQRMEELDIPMEDRKWDRWERVFHLSATDPFDKDIYTAAERLLRREKIWATRTPTFEERAPIELDLDKPMAKPMLLARGGLGGKGNTFFAGITGYRQPRFSSRGIIPYMSTFEVELKIIADVGLVGFPNAGKSTILRALTGRRAEVAGYQFTTLNPQVGVVKVWDDGTWGSGGSSAMGDEGVVQETWKEKRADEARRQLGDYAPLTRAPRYRTKRELDDDAATAAAPDEGVEVKRGLDGEKVEAYRYTISDNPGLLPQASANVGLGHSFLRSIERCLALAYVVDIARPNPEQDLLDLRQELETYKPGLAAKGAVVILNKGDDADAEAGRTKVEQVKRAIAELDEGREGKIKVVVVSGKYGLGLDKLVRALGERVESVRDELDREEERKRNESRF